MNAGCRQRQSATAGFLLLSLALFGSAVAQDADSMPFAPPLRSISIGLLRPHLLGATVLDFDARFDPYRVGVSVGGYLTSTGFFGPTFRAGYTFWQRPRCFIRFGESRYAGQDADASAGFCGFLPEAYVLAEAVPFIYTIDGPPSYKYAGTLTANIAVEYYFLRAHLSGGAALAYMQPLGLGTQPYRWTFGPAMNAGITLGSFTVGF